MITVLVKRFEAGGRGWSASRNPGAIPGLFERLAPDEAFVSLCLREHPGLDLSRTHGVRLLQPLLTDSEQVALFDRLSGIVVAASVCTLLAIFWHRVGRESDDGQFVTE